MDRLPEELLEHIVIQVRLNEDGTGDARRSLASLCRTNKKCYRVALPLLYQQIDVNLTGPSASALEGLLQRTPYLGQRVRDLRLWAATIPSPATRDVHELHQRNVAKFLDAMQEQYGSNHAALNIFREYVADNDPYQSGSEDFWGAGIALFLVHCSNIEVMELDMCGVNFEDGRLEDYLQGAALMRSYATNSEQLNDKDDAPAARLLRQMHTLIIGSGNTSRSPMFAGFAPLLGVATLRTLKIKNLRQARSTIDVLDSETLAPIERLELEHTTVSDQEQLGAMFKAWQHSMTSLRVSWAPRISIHNRFTWYRCRHLLQEYGQNLTTLSLTAHKLRKLYGMTERNFGDFRPLQRLRHLEIDEVGLIGIAYFPRTSVPHFHVAPLPELLPRTLETLTVLHCTNEQHNILEYKILELLQDTQFSNLKKIKLCGKEGLTADVELLGWKWKFAVTDVTQASGSSMVLERL